MSTGTREACKVLGISPTTLKRWISYFPDVFPKDRLGHYLFTEREMGLLRQIKEQVRSGVQLERIELPVPRSIPPEAEISSDSAIGTLLQRVGLLEDAVSRKADEVVTAQIYEHRQELEELQRMVRQLAATIEAMQTAAAGRQADASSESAALAPRKKTAKTAGRRKFLFF